MADTRSNKPQKLNIGASELSILSKQHKYKKTDNEWWRKYLTVGVRSFQTRKIFLYLLNLIIENGEDNEQIEEKMNSIINNEEIVDIQVSEVQNTELFTEFSNAIEEENQSNIIVKCKEEETLSTIDHQLTNLTQLSVALNSIDVTEENQDSVNYMKSKVIEQKMLFSNIEDVSEVSSITDIEFNSELLANINSNEINMLTSETLDNQANIQCSLSQYQGAKIMHSTTLETKDSVTEKLIEHCENNNLESRSIGVIVETGKAQGGELKNSNDKFYNKNYNETLTFFAKVDGFSDDNVPIEMKTRRNRLFDNIPLYELIQCSVILHVTESNQLIWRQVYRTNEDDRTLNKKLLTTYLTEAVMYFQMFDNVNRDDNGYYSLSKLVNSIYTSLSVEDLLTEAKYVLNMANERQWI